MPVRFTNEELAAFEGATVDDLVGDGMRLLFVGINPGLWTAATNAHFARRGNRFWPALHRAGVTPTLVDASNGMTAGDRDMVLARGIGITNVVNVATARADQLTLAQAREGGQHLLARVAAWRPQVIAVLGLTVFRQAYGAKAVTAGRQPRAPERDESGAQWWVLPNPSGLNAHETLDSLAAVYGDAARAAGVF